LQRVLEYMINQIDEVSKGASVSRSFDVVAGGRVIRNEDGS
jgi:hypothetical protein